MLNGITSIGIPDLNLTKTEIDCQKTKVLEFTGITGKIKYPNKEYDVDNIKISIGNDITIKGVCDLRTDRRDMFNLFFSSDDGWEITISKCAILTHNWPSNKVIANGLNFKATKGQIDDQDSVQVYKILENLKIGDSTKFISNELNNLFLFDEKIEDFPFSTGYFAFQDTYKSIDNKWDTIFNNFHFLLGFFASNFVGLRAYYIYGPNDYKEIRISPINETTGSGSSIFWPDRTWETSKFLNSAYDNFLRYKDDLNLPVVLNYYVWMKNSPYIDSHKYLLGVILLETLKFAYASKLKRYPKDSKNRFLKPTPSGNKIMTYRKLIEEIYSEFDIDVAKLQAKYLKQEFNTDLSKLCSEFHFNFKDICQSENFIKYLTKYRNEVVHEGNIKLHIPGLKKQMNQLEWSIEILLLKILGVNSSYWDSCEDGWVDSQELFKKIQI